MPDIRYIILSDTHLGAHTSVLTHLDGDGRVDGRGPSRCSAPTAVALEASRRRDTQR